MQPNASNFNQRLCILAVGCRGGWSFPSRLIWCTPVHWSACHSTTSVSSKRNLPSALPPEFKTSSPMPSFHHRTEYLTQWNFAPSHLGRLTARGRPSQASPYPEMAAWLSQCVVHTASTSPLPSRKDVARGHQLTIYFRPIRLYSSIKMPPASLLSK